MNILITGGAGYIGSHCVRALLEAGHTVVVYDNLIYGHRGAIESINQHGGYTCELIVGDLHEKERLVSILQENKIEAVMHFAAYAFVGESVENPAKYYQNNIVAALSLLDAVKETNINKFVFSSTTATYGEPTTIPIAETEPQQPINPYGFTKLVFEQALADYAHSYGLGYAALRYFNAAGASPDGLIGEDHTPETHLIPLVLQVALGQRENITIFGQDYPTPDGTCIRDYIHVNDLAAAHIKALQHIRPAKGLKLNLGTGRGNSVLEIIEAARKVTGHPIPALEGTRREGDPPELVANSQLAQKTLDWQPRYTNIEETIATAWAWHKNHPRGYRQPS
ncbi:MAG: UDP-glucose 4-epimerase GalE [Pirellulaceae bacterium]|nr:UDP-glucose 4-epimerase GalE [Pirellulaceae bacterium]